MLNKNHFKIVSYLILLLGFFSCKKAQEVVPVAPVIQSISPSEGTIGTELKIEGSGFKEGATVHVGDYASESVEIEENTIFAKVPEGITANTTYAVTLTNPDGGTVKVEGAFKGVAPVLSFVNSATKPSGNIGSTVILEGDAFGDLQGPGQVLFSDGSGGTIPAEIVDQDDWTNTFIITTVPQGTGDGPVLIKTGTGESNEIPFIIASGATFSPSAINWKEAASLPVGVSGHNAEFAFIDDDTHITRTYVYVTGGRSHGSESLDQVLYGEIGEDGNITSWHKANALPAPLSFHAQVASTPFNSKVDGSGFLYVLGGANSEGEPVRSVSMAKLNQDGSVGSWTSTQELPQALHSLGAVIFRSNIYIAGGATTGNVPVAKVYKAAINIDGTLGEWEELSSMPSAVAHHGFVIFGGVLYTVGGETEAVEIESQTSLNRTAEVAFAKVNIRTGKITDAGWTINENTMQKSRSKHITLVAGGNMFISSGLYSGAAGSSENIFAQINSDGTVGSFGGATGSNTLNSVGGANLFSPAGVSYVDANGAAHVLIIGGDNVNQPGDKRNKVLYY